MMGSQGFQLEKGLERIKMRWTPKDIHRWRKWFAWYPVTIQVDRAAGGPFKYNLRFWLEMVERRYDEYMNWEYRLR